MISNTIGKTTSPAPKKHPSTMANRQGLAEITPIAAATASGLAKRAIGVKPQMSANNNNASATVPIFVVVLTAIPIPERSARVILTGSLVAQYDNGKGELLLLVA